MCEKVYTMNLKVAKYAGCFQKKSVLDIKSVWEIVFALWIFAVSHCEKKQLSDFVHQQIEQLTGLDKHIENCTPETLQDKLWCTASKTTHF